MSKTNPCNSPADRKTFETCVKGMEAYNADLKPIVESKQQVGVSWMNDSTNTSQLEEAATLKIQEFASKIEQQKVSCFSKDNIQACGYTRTAVEMEKNVGSLSLFQSKAPTEDVPFVDSATHYIIVKNNSTKQEVIIDTGCTVSAFPPSFIENNPNRFKRVSTAQNYDIGLYQSSGIKLLFGQTKIFSPSLVVVAPVLDFLEGTEVGQRFVSIIGQDFLSSHAYEINYDNNVMRVDQDVKKRVGEGEWKAVPFRATSIPSFWISVDIYVNGTKLPFILDTGASNSDIIPTCANHLGLDTTEGNSLQQGVSENHEIENSEPLSITVGDHTFDNMVMSISAENDPNTKTLQMTGACGVLGLDILHQFNVIYDPYTFNLYFQKRDNTPSAPQFSLGILPSRDASDGKMLAKAVGSKSAAEKAGVRVGDKIISINGIPSEEMTIYGFKEFTYKNKPPFVFAILSNGEEKIITIPPKPLSAKLEESEG